ncbi:MAG: hypothetical protein Q4G45_03080 [Actinomycetia bacterium]|nr:hypothetical protein [Actinomycetes bacterium]
MRYHDDDEIVAVDIEEGRVVGVSLKNSWRDRMTTAQLGQTLTAQLARAWSEPMIEAAQALMERPVVTPAPTPSTPSPSLASRQPDLAYLAAISEHISQITARTRAKLTDPTYLSSLTPPAQQTYVSRDGYVSLGHVGDQITEVQLQDDYFRKAPVMAASETIQRAFDEFYQSDHPLDPQSDPDPELTADRAQLDRILQELETL